MGSIQICNPTAPSPALASGAPGPLAQLRGARVAVVSNGWMSMSLISAQLAARLPAEYGVGSVQIHVVEPNGGATEAVLARITKEADVAIVGLANCGGCTSWSVQNQLELMKRGVYSVLLVTERFNKLAEVIRRGRGIADAPFVVLPETEITEYGNQEIMLSIADQALHNSAAKLAMRRAA